MATNQENSLLHVRDFRYFTVVENLCEQENSTTQINSTQDVSCEAIDDGISCWPNTKSGTTAVIPCFSHFNNIRYNTSDNATRYCFPNGTWEFSSNYSRCQPILEHHEILKNNWNVVDEMIIIYYVGFTISLVALVTALIIFFYFKNLRCLRNTFHANLMLTYVLVDLMWIITASSHSSDVEEGSGVCVMVIFLYYFKGTNFFWMFVEGFYLYLLVVRTFTVDKIKFPFYLFLGWGTPAIVVIVWAAVKTKLRMETNRHVHYQMEYTVNLGCPWLQEHDYDWIFYTPILVVLFVNCIFLIKIMWVLITKLQAATVAETKQYRKAAKSLLVLIPLLGVTYILVITAPKKGLLSVIFAFLRPILISTQGFTVSVLYCFLNSEVRNTLRHHWQRWREGRSVGGRSCQSHRCLSTDSFKSRTESFRLSMRLSGRNERESCTSCVTNNSTVGNGCTVAVSQISPTVTYPINNIQ